MIRSNHRQRALASWILLLLCMTGAGILRAAEPAAGDPLQLVPAESLFCVRIGNLNTTMGQLDQFLTGVAPVGISMPVRSKLGQLLGSPEAKGVNMSGSFTLFGPLPGGEGMSPARIGLLIPVSDYQQFVEGNPNVTAPDAQGISRLGPEGDQNLATVKVDNYALVTSLANRQALADVKSWVTGTGVTPLAKRLSAEELKRAAGAQVWAYVNIQTVSKMFGPMIQQKIQEIKQKVGEVQAQMKDQPMMGQAGAFMDMYLAVFNSLMQETQFVSLALDPSANVLRMSLVTAAMPNTEMAKLLSTTGPQQPLNLLGYLRNGAIANVAAAPNPAFSRAVTLKYIDLLSMLMGQTASKEETAQLKQLATDSLDAFGGSVAWSFLPDVKNRPPFQVQYAVTLKDKQKFYEVLERAAKLMSDGMIAKFYEKLGLKMQFTLKRNVETYKEVPVDAAHLAIQPVDANTPQAQMIKAMYGEGFDIRLAAVNNLLVYALSSEPTDLIHKLIDQAKAGGPGQIPSEVQAALQLIPDAKQSGFFGTYNFLRLFQMIVAMMPMPMPQVNLPTQSNVAFAGDVGGGRLMVEAAIPKQHVLELMTVFTQMQQQKMQEQEQQQQEQQGNM